MRRSALALLLAQEDSVDERQTGVHLSADQRADWLRLIRAENVGPRTFRALLDRYGAAAAALRALPGLARLGGRGSLHIPTRDEVEAEIAAATAIGVRFIALGEPEYPPRLREIDDAPPLLAVRGKCDLLVRPAVAVVGARNASMAGMRFARSLARGLGEAGFAVVSGLARGIDSAAHRGSLATGTIAVLAGGHDKPYPPEHAELLQEIVATGVAIGEMPLGWEPRAHDFPRRNRIIAGIALGVVVVEAAERSGSLITARLALEQGREVFAVPGSPIDPRAQGTNRLLKQGATLVSSAADVVEVLTPILDRPESPRISEPERTTAAANADDALRGRILELLGPAPVPVDDLVREARTPAATVQIVLLELELAGRLQRHGGGLVSLC
jgi:DNA processing protein